MAAVADPAQLAYMRLLGIDPSSPGTAPTSPGLTAAQTAAQANANRELDYTKQAYGLNQAEAAHQGELARTNIGFGFEDRGLGSSGMYQQAIEEQRRRQKYEADLAALQYNNSIAGIQSSLAAQQAAMSQWNLAGLFGMYQTPVAQAGAAGIGSPVPRGFGGSGLS